MRLPRIQFSLATLILWCIATGAVLGLNLRGRLTYIDGYQYGFPFRFVNVWHDQHDSFRILWWYRPLFIGIWTEENTIRIDVLPAVLNLAALILMLLIIKLLEEWLRRRGSKCKAVQLIVGNNNV